MVQVTIISILIFIYVIYSIFAFKMIDYSYKDTYDIRDTHYMHSNNAFLRHRQSKNSSFWQTVFNSGVCSFGKFGFIVLVLWSIILMCMLIFYNKDNRNKVLDILAIINLTFVLVYGILTRLMNWPLFIRCIPYLALQLAVSIWIFFI